MGRGGKGGGKGRGGERRGKGRGGEGGKEEKYDINMMYLNSQMIALGFT